MNQIQAPSKTPITMQDKTLKIYNVIRIVKEVYQVTAVSKEEARLNIQDPSSVTVMKETIKIDKTV